MKLLLTTAISVLLFSLNSYSQSMKYQKFEYKWPTEKPEPIALDEMYLNQDAIILQEKCIFNIAGNLVPPKGYYLSSGGYFFYDETKQDKTPIVQKYIRIKFLTKKGVSNFSRFTIPESFDPQHDLQIVPIEKRHTLILPKGEFECVRYFVCRIIKPDGTIRKAEVKDSTIQAIQRLNGQDYKFYNWLFDIKNLEPGDELELDYAYEGSYTYSPSLHLFFNGILPKQNYQFTFRERLKETHLLFPYNISSGPDTVISDKGLTNYREYIFKAKNLKGGISETGARPAEELSYISFYRHFLDFGTSDNNSSVIIYPLPYPWAYFLNSMLSFRYDNLDFHLGWKDKTTVAMNKFVNEERSKISDTSLAAIMSGIQHSINENFEYADDINYIEGNDTKLEKLGRNVEAKILRQISRHNFYNQIFLRLDKEYYLSVVPDKRTDKINPYKYESLGLADIFYAVPYKNEFLFFYPKTSRFGYEANELPFYYEGVVVALVPQLLPSEMKTDMFPKVDYKFIKTPTSTYKDNKRRSSAVVKASLDSLSAETRGKLKLSGQFSTMTRGYLLYGAKDTTVNPAYFKSVLDLSSPKNNVIITKADMSPLFPFEATFNYTFKSDNFIRKESDNTYSFDLKGWFNNISDDHFQAENRQLAYYPDFKSEDSHQFMIQFDSPVKLLDPTQLRDTITNSYGYYLVTAEQKSENQILVETLLIVHSEIVAASKANEVQSIFDSIKIMNNRKFRIKKV